MPTPQAAPAARGDERELCDNIIRVYLGEIDGHYAKGTLRSKTMAARRFLGWCRVQGVDPLEAGTDDVDMFCRSLNRSLSFFTTREYCCNVRVFLRWLRLKVSVHLIETGGQEDARAIFLPEGSDRCDDR